MVSAIGGPPALFATPTPATGVPTTLKDTGAVGSKISLIANATHGTAAAAYSTVTAYWGAQTAANIIGTGAADGDGYYRIDVVIPSATAGAHPIIVNDGIGAAAGVDFTVTSSVTASTSPSTKDTTYDAKVQPGDVMTVVGHGFPGGDTMNITIENTTTVIPITTPVATSNSTGSFSVVITVPTILVAAYGDYTVNATDEADNFATSPILIDYYVTVTPTSGPSGVTITVSGRIPANQAYTILIDTTTIASGTSASDGTFTSTYVIPSLIAETGHTIYVRWVVASVINTRNVAFTVTAAPLLTYLSATSGVAGAVITISGTGFSALANITLTLDSTVVNSTSMDDRFGPTSVLGAFTNEQFTVPALTPGIYLLKVADQYGASTNGSTTFTITPTPTTTIALRGTGYYQGDTLSFNIITTEDNLGTMTVTIYDPSNRAQWTIATWVPAGVTTKIVPIQAQVDTTGNPITLPADAPLGSWNWTVMYTPASTGVATKATALFTVAALPNMQNVLDAIDGLEGTITGAITTSEGKIMALINTKSGTITADIAALDPQLQGITDTCVVIATMLGEVQVAIDDLDMGTLGVDIAAIKGDVATIKTNIGTVSVSVDSLDAVLGAVAGQCAEVQTTLGTLEGKIDSISGNTATVITDVGTIQADITDVKGKVDMTPVWIAVVLSLVAAIAAIFAVITIRQKIAG
jgi:hypothetical protein